MTNDAYYAGKIAASDLLFKGAGLGTEMLTRAGTHALGGAAIGAGVGAASAGSGNRLRGAGYGAVAGGAIGAAGGAGIGAMEHFNPNAAAYREATGQIGKSGPLFDQAFKAEADTAAQGLKGITAARGATGAAAAAGGYYAGQAAKPAPWQPMQGMERITPEQMRDFVQNARASGELQLTQPMQGNHKLQFSPEQEQQMQQAMDQYGGTPRLPYYQHTQ